MENTISINLPVFISYPALEAAVKKKMAGEFIKTREHTGEEVRQAQILNIAIGYSSHPAYDLVINLRISILRTLLRREAVDLQVLASLAYDNEQQLLYVSKYTVDARTQSSFYNGSLELLANNVGYGQIIKKARVSVREILAREQLKVNGLLAEGLKLKGLTLTGSVGEVMIQNLYAQPEQLSLILIVKANVEAAITDLISLMPPPKA